MVGTLRSLYQQRVGRFERRLDEDDGDDGDSGDYRRLQYELILAQRDALDTVANESGIPTGVERRIEHELDLEEARLPR
jgi:superfamily II DNA or RNA helicase